MLNAQLGVLEYFLPYVISTFPPVLFLSNVLPAGLSLEFSLEHVARLQKVKVKYQIALQSYACWVFYLLTQYIGRNVCIITTNISIKVQPC